MEEWLPTGFNVAATNSNQICSVRASEQADSQIPLRSVLLNMDVAVLLINNASFPGVEETATKIKVIICSKILGRKQQEVIHHRSRRCRPTLACCGAASHQRTESNADQPRDPVCPLLLHCCHRPSRPECMFPVGTITL